MNKLSSMLLISIFLSVDCYATILKEDFSNKVINSFLIYLGGGNAIKKEDIKTLSKFDLIVLDRFRYKNVKKNTWKELKNENNNIKVLLYQNGAEVSDNTDHLEQYYLNNIGRLNVSRGQSSGAISKNSKWFLTNHLGVKLKNSLNTHSYQLDYGNNEFRNYWIQSTYEDIINKPWKADGIMIDNCATAKVNIVNKILLKNSKQYPDVKSSDTALNGFLNDVTAALHQHKQIVMPNRTNSRLVDGEKAWLDLDKKAHPPDIVFDEGAFSVSWGLGDVQFYSHDEWVRQISMPKQIKNSSVAFLSHTDLKPGQKGTSSRGNTVSFEQIFWYSLGSYLLAKNVNEPYTLFGFDYDRNEFGDYKRISWFNIYKNLNLGSAMGEAKHVSNKSNDIYVREFKNGYVYVNPSLTNVKNIPLILKDTVAILDQNIDGVLRYKSVQVKDKISMDAHTSIIILKKSYLN